MLTSLAAQGLLSIAALAALNASREDGSRVGISSRSHHLPTARCQRTRDHEHLGLPLASLIQSQDNEEKA